MHATLATCYTCHMPHLPHAICYTTCHTHYMPHPLHATSATCHTCYMPRPLHATCASCEFFLLQAERHIDSLMTTLESHGQSHSNDTFNDSRRCSALAPDRSSAPKCPRSNQVFRPGTDGRVLSVCAICLG